MNFGSIEELVDFSFNCFYGLIRPAQIREEIIELLKILSKRKPKVVLEIGTAKGGTLFLFSRIASEDATLISVDLPGGKFGGGYPEWKIPLYKAFALPTQDIHLIRADSHDPKTLEIVKEILNGRKVDFCFIDGDHTYEGVKADFEMYSPLVKKGGIIAFHDIVHHPFDPDCQVDKFWNEIKHRYKTKEIVSSKQQTWAGIGILEV
ncbi:MAG: class I SAM-dependent methyltransferase [Candidatus Marinimicrobia bacterium]|nr:class I SAM-dependent methyltransferase [Candidatus Neomarinimicrobiota bacterium]